MTFHQWAFIYLGTGTEDEHSDRAVIDAGGIKTTIVAVPDEAAAVRIAVELVDGGAQTLELCGGFGPRVLPDVLEATGGRVPVGQVRYGAEAMRGLSELFAVEA